MDADKEIAEDFELMRSAATVHAVRKEVGPRVGALVERLRSDPLGDESTSRELVAVLESERAQQGRAARALLPVPESRVGSR
jgi:hypothetical protein